VIHMKILASETVLLIIIRCAYNLDILDLPSVILFGISVRTYVLPDSDLINTQYSSPYQLKNAVHPHYILLHLFCFLGRRKIYQHISHSNSNQLPGKLTTFHSTNQDHSPRYSFTEIDSSSNISSCMCIMY